MFELLQAYETAKNEKNKFLRFFYVNHVKHKLKKDFFEKFAYNINNFGTDKELIEEFYNFFDCTYDGIHTRMNTSKSPYITYASGIFSKIHIRYGNQYEIKFKIFEDSIDIELIDIQKSIIVSIHPDNKVFYDSLFSRIIIMAIYNYCVAYIYGKYSKLFINDDRYINQILNMYF